MKIIKSLLLSLLFFPISLSAQQIINSPQAICGTSKDLNTLIEHTKENPVINGQSYRQLQSGQFILIDFVIFYNEQEKTYTFVEKMNDDLYCVISFGTIQTKLIFGTPI